MEPTKNINISVKLQQAMDQKNKELGTSYMLSQANFIKRDHLNIPNNWPNPWKEIDDGIVSLFGKEVFRYKKYLRPAGFKIYGLSMCKKYCRIWRGKKGFAHIICSVASKHIQHCHEVLYRRHANRHWVLPQRDASVD